MDDIQPRQQANSIHAARIAERLIVGKLHVGPGLDGFLDEFGVLERVELVGDSVSDCIHHAEAAVIVLQLPFRTDQPEK